MNRITRALLALFGRLEPEVREVHVPVFSGAHVSPIYCATRHDGLGGRYQTYYLTCEQAHLENPGCEVSKSDAIKVGDRYFGNRWGLYEITPQPKPKVAKGKRSGK